MVKETTTTDASLSTNYVAVVPMTFEEKVKMYMRCTKIELARMLAERDRLYDGRIETVPCPYPVPTYPAPNTAPWPMPWYNTKYEITCENTSENTSASTYSSSSTME